MRRMIMLGTCLAVLGCGAMAQGVTQEQADEMLSEQAWADAAQAYSDLLSDDADNAGNWFNLGSAYHQLGSYDKAKDAYGKAIDKGFNRVPLVRIRLARIHMSLGDLESALTELETVAETGGPNGRQLSTIAEFEPMAEDSRFKAVIAALTPCTDDAYRHFDFWLGKWDVTSTGNSSAHAKSDITAREDGCVVLEEYQTQSGYRGMSINFYDSNRKVWHQTWMANNGSPIYLEGGLNADGAMVLSDKGLASSAASGSINRVTWSVEESGGVRQFWESSSDDGETWTVAFDGYYLPRAE